MKTIITFEIKGHSGLAGKWRLVVSPKGGLPGLKPDVTMVSEALGIDAMGIEGFHAMRPGFEGFGWAVQGFVVNRLIGKSFEERGGCRYADLGVLELSEAL